MLCGEYDIVGQHMQPQMMQPQQMQPLALKVAIKKAISRAESLVIKAHSTTATRQHMRNISMLTANIECSPCKKLLTMRHIVLQTSNPTIAIITVHLLWSVVRSKFTG